ncbi:MAG: hypothetical protein IJ808_08020 [Muribaculaceae bacterium]|nr:hypothetical protein [Muribaculaceae bacterium]
MNTSIHSTIVALLMLTCSLFVPTVAYAQSHVDMKILNESDIKALPADVQNYTWPISGTNANANTSSVLDPATDPAQMIALLRHIYITKDFPGIYFAAYGDPDGNYLNVRTRPVFYGAPYYYSDNSNYNFDDRYSYSTRNSWGTTYYTRNGWFRKSLYTGWNISIDDEFPFSNNRSYRSTETTNSYGEITSNPNSNNNTQTIETIYTNSGMTSTPTNQHFKPDNEGYTVLLVQMKDSWTKPTSSMYSSDYATYEQLYNLFSNAFESIQLIPEGVRVTDNTDVMNDGALFNINAQDVNKFFILSKGQARLNGSTLSLAPFAQMYEQFSPNQTNDSKGKEDFYTNMVLNGTPQAIVHDCNSVINNGHEFVMSGSGGSGKYPLNNMLFFIPDYRLYYWKSSSGNYDGRITSTSYSYATSTTYANYNQDHAPKVVMYNVKLEAEASQTEAQKEPHKYTVTLKWKSNLNTYAPSLYQRYYLYPVVNGKPDTDHPLVAEGTLSNSKDELTYSYEVDQIPSGYSLTFVVQAYPLEKVGDDYEDRFSLQLSNNATVQIPGFDQQERLQLVISSDYFSQYDAENEVNKYWNKIPMNNGVGTSVTEDYITAGTNPSTFKFYRYEYDDLGNVEGEPLLFANVVVTSKASNRINYRIDLVDGTQTTVDSQQYPATTGYFTYNGNYSDVDFRNFYICDQFIASTRENKQRSKYGYIVRFEAAKEFEIEKINLETGEFVRDEDGNIVKEMTKNVYSNEVNILVHKTESKLNTDDLHYSWSEVLKDTDRHLDKISDVKMSVDFKLSPQSEIFRYNANYGQNVPTTEFAFAQNQAGYYEMSDGNQVTAPGTGSFVNDQIKVGSSVGNFNHVPVISVYPPSQERRDNNERNTYGCDIKTAPIGKVDVNFWYSGVDALDTETNPEAYPMMDKDASDLRYGNWKVDDKVFTYYKAALLANATMPTGYEPVLYRAWRVIKDSDVPTGYTARDFVGEYYADRTEKRITTNADGDVDVLFDEINVKELGYTENPTNNAELLIHENGGVKLGYAYVDADADAKFGYAEPQRNETRGTFGALRINDGTDNPNNIGQFDATFIVRVYYRKIAEETGGNGQSVRRRLEPVEDSQYYIVEQEIPWQFLSSTVVTGIDDVDAIRTVHSVTYYNGLGQMSMRPFSGVNIVVTRYTDGTTSTGKAVY